MLEKIRNSAHHYLFKLLFLLIAIIFAIGLLDFSSPNTSSLAKVGEQNISLSEFLEAKQNMLRKLGLNNVDITKQQEFVDFNVITQLTTQKLIEQETKNLGINVSPEVAVEYIKTYPIFQKDGVFDLESYNKALEYNNIKEEQLIENISAQITSKFLLDSLFVNSSIKLLFNNYLQDYLSQKILASVITVDTNKINISNVPDEKLKDYYQHNTNLFFSKEYRNFSYLIISQQNLKLDQPITESQMEEEYQVNKESYYKPETRNFHHFLCPNLEIADKVAKALKQEPNSEKVAKSFIDKKVINEVFTNQTEQSFLASLDPSLFQVKEGEVTAIIKSDLGWHVFKVLEILPKKYKSFAEAKNDIENNLKFKMHETALNELLKSIDEEVASGAEFEEVATKFNTKLLQVNNVAIDNSYSAKEKDSGKINPEILELVFQMQDKEESSIIMLADNQNYALIRIDGITPARLLEFEEVKDLVKIEYLKKLKDNIAFEAAQILRNKLSEENQTLISNDGKTLNNQIIEVEINPLYTKYNLDPKGVISVTLNQEYIAHPEVGTNNIPESLARELFEQQQEKISSVNKVDYAKYSVALINQTTKEENNQIAADLAKNIEMINENNYKDSIYHQYINYLKSKYKVEINMDLLNKYYSQF